MSWMVSSALKDCVDNEKYDQLSDDTSIYGNQKDVLGDESNVGLFRKYVLTAKGKESSESMKRRLSFSAINPQQIAHTSRPSTLLEKHLLPALESNGKLPVSSGENKMSKPQLTIFYGGAINVYDNVSVDQAQAIFRLASGATVSPSAITKTPKVNILKTQKDHQQDNTPSIRKMQEDLPIARKISLRHFLEKRRARIMNKCPYPTPSSSTTRHDKEHNERKQDRNTNDDSTEEKCFLNSPFPSRGYFFPISTNKRC